jgi:hypothetical protein
MKKKLYIDAIKGKMKLPDDDSWKEEVRDILYYESIFFRRINFYFGCNLFFIVLRKMVILAQEKKKIKSIYLLK